MSVLRRDKAPLTFEEALELARALAGLEAAADRACKRLSGRAKAARLDRILPTSAARRTWFVLRMDLAREWGTEEGNPFEGETWNRLRRHAATYGDI